MSINLTDAIFNDEDVVRKHCEAIRWRTVRNARNTIGRTGYRVEGREHPQGCLEVRACAKPFFATLGTAYERSHIALHKWLLATHLLRASKKGMSALANVWLRLLKTAWFMAHRIREGMRDDTNKDEAGLGGANTVVEADET